MRHAKHDTRLNEIAHLEDQISKLQYQIHLEDQISELQDQISNLEEEISQGKKNRIQDLRDDGYTVPHNITDDDLHDLHIDSLGP